MKRSRDPPPGSPLAPGTKAKSSALRPSPRAIAPTRRMKAKNSSSPLRPADSSQGRSTPTKRQDVAKSSESDPKSLRKLLEKEIAPKLGLRKLPRDFYHLRASHLVHSDSGLLKRHQSVLGLVSTAYPAHPWQAWRFPVAPKLWWHDTNHQREYLDWLQKKLRYKGLEGLYSLTMADLAKLGGGHLASRHKGSISNAVMALYPQHEWEPWRFVSPPKNWAAQKENRHKFGRVLRAAVAAGEGSSAPAQLTTITRELIEKLGGRALLHLFGNSPRRVVAAVLGESLATPTPSPTNQWKFSKVPKKYWEDSNHKREFFDGVLKNYLSTMDLAGLYGLTREEIAKLGGSKLIPPFGTVAEVVMSTYPKHGWQAWRFTSSPPRSWWKSSHSQRLFMDWMKEQMGATSFEGLYLLTPTRITEAGGGYLMKLYNNNVRELLAKVYPQYEWKAENFQTNRSAVNQRSLAHAVRQQLPTAKLSQKSSKAKGEAAEGPT